ncbi:MAG: sulfotransferase, partial [Gemmatimonadota bacterium]|nr:sulfotransferase [Gemmatimonadota bacterium]
TGQLGERAHGDGMLVSYDSPEAFEEASWVFFWPEKFGADRIGLWSDDDPVEKFREFFVEQMQKILVLRLGDEAGRGRYLSKNNANIARLGFLKRCFPDCRILVPFREPVEQALSLLRQHERFTAVHRTEAFSRRYMRDIGHFEFGALHRPIRFDALEAALKSRRPESLDYWIAYWVAAFQHILRHEGALTFVSYDRLCERGSAAVEVLAAQMDAKAADLMAGAGGRLRPPRKHAADGVEASQDQDLRVRAGALYAQLLERSIV